LIWRKAGKHDVLHMLTAKILRLLALRDRLAKSTFAKLVSWRKTVSFKMAIAALEPVALMAMRE